MSQSFKAIFVAALSLIFIASCGKYEDGPSFSIRSKTKRIVGEWELVSFNEGDEIIRYVGTHAAELEGCGTQTIYDKTFKQQNVVWDIESDNDIKQRYTEVVLKHNYSESYTTDDCNAVYNTLDSSATAESLRWNFNNKKEELKIELDYQVYVEYQILRLTNSELKLEDLEGNILFFEKRK